MTVSDPKGTAKHERSATAVTVQLISVIHAGFNSFDKYGGINATGVVACRAPA